MGWCSSCSPLQLQQSSAASKLRPPLTCWQADNKKVFQSDLPHYLCSYDSDSPPPRWMAGQMLPYIHVFLIYHMDFTAVCDLLRSEQQMRLRVFATFKSVHLSKRMWMHIFLWCHRNLSQKAFSGSRPSADTGSWCDQKRWGSSEPQNAKCCETWNLMQMIVLNSGKCKFKHKTHAN